MNELANDAFGRKTAAANHLPANRDRQPSGLRVSTLMSSWRELFAQKQWLTSWIAAARTAFRAPDASLAGVLAPWRRFGWAVVVAFLGGSVLWAATARLDGAAIASGVIAVESKRKTIQHLEGGIIKEIVTAEGAHVAAGDVLVRFDDTPSLARPSRCCAAASPPRWRCVRGWSPNATAPAKSLSRTN